MENKTGNGKQDRDQETGERSGQRREAQGLH